MDTTISQTPYENTQKSKPQYHMVTNSGNKFTMEPLTPFVNNKPKTPPMISNKSYHFAMNQLKSDTLQLSQLKKQLSQMQQKINELENTKNNINPKNIINPPSPNDNILNPPSTNDNIQNNTTKLLALHNYHLIPALLINGSPHDTNKTATIEIYNKLYDYDYKYLYRYNSEFEHKNVNNINEEQLNNYVFHPGHFDNDSNYTNNQYDDNNDESKTTNTITISKLHKWMDPSTNLIYPHFNPTKQQLALIGVNNKLQPITILETDNVNTKIQFLRTGEIVNTSLNNCIYFDIEKIDQSVNTNGIQYYYSHPNDKPKQIITNSNRSSPPPSRKRKERKKKQLQNKRKEKKQYIHELPDTTKLSEYQISYWNSLNTKFKIIHDCLVDNLNDHNTALKLAHCTLNQSELETLFENKILCMDDIQFFADNENDILQYNKLHNEIEQIQTNKHPLFIQSPKNNKHNKTHHSQKQKNNKNNKKERKKNKEKYKNIII